MGWSMSTSRESAMRSREAKAQADFTRFESILQALGDQMTSVNEDLSEAVSELTASRLQSREIKQAIVESMELQAQLAKNWDAFESEWLGPEDDEFRSEFCQLKDDESDSEICPPKTMDEFEAEWWPAPPVVGLSPVGAKGCAMKQFPCAAPPRHCNSRCLSDKKAMAETLGDRVHNDGFLER